MFSFFKAPLLLGAMCWITIPGAAAAPPEPEAAHAPGRSHAHDAHDALSLREALARTEARHPLYASWRERERAAAARRVQAGLRPSPELSIEVENVLGSGRVSGVSAAETTLGISQLIERGALRESRLEAASAEQALLRDDFEIARLDQRAEVARRFVHVLSDQAQLALTREATQLAQDTLTEVQRRVRAARAPLAEESRAQVALERARLEEEHAEHELLSSRRHLAAASGSVEVDFGPAHGELLELPEVASFETLLDQIRAAPDLIRFASETRLRESELRLAQARQARPLTLGAGLRRLEERDDVGWVFSASWPLFGAARTQGQTQEAEARIAQLGPDREQAFLKQQAQLYALWQELQHARVEHEAQRDRVVPAMERALRQTEDAWRRGRYSLLELREAQSEWLAQRRHLIRSATEFHEHHLDIQRLTGARVSVLASGNPS